MDKPLPDDFDLSEHYGDASYDERYDDEDDEDQEREQKAANHRPKRPARNGAPEVSKSAHEKSSMLKALFEFFIPSLNQDPETKRRWRISIGFAVFCLSTATLHSYGVFAPFGFQGFANAASVKSVEDYILNKDLFDTRLLQCKALTPESRQFYAKRMQELTNKFLETKGLYPNLPTCAEVQ